MKVQVFDSVFDAIARSADEAASMNVRSTLLSGLQDRIRSWEVPQDVAAARLRITRQRLDDLLRGKLGAFSLNELFDLCQRVCAVD